MIVESCSKENYDNVTDDEIYDDDLQKYYTGYPKNSLPENKNYQPIIDDNKYEGVDIDTKMMKDGGLYAKYQSYGYCEGDNYPKLW